MRQNRKKTRILILLVLLLGISIGFAYLNAELDILGIASIRNQKWDVYWANPQVSQGSVSQTAPEIEAGEDDTPNTKVSFSVNMTQPGQFYEFTVDAVNNGAIDAMITGISSKVNNTDIDSDPSPLPAYVGYTVTYDDGTEIKVNDTLLKKTNNTPTTKTYKVKVEWKTDVDSSSLGNQELTLNFKFEVTYGQYEAPETAWELPNGRTKDNLQVGDEICGKASLEIGDQCFNFIRYDGNDVVLLAKYNLKVGNIYSVSRTKTGEYTSSDTGYGKQNSDVRGYMSGQGANGTVIFSTTNYWDDSGSPKSDYPGSYFPGPNYPTVYDATNYKGVPGTNNYSIAYYVDAYKTLLTTEYGATIKNARLLTYAEATDSSIGCNASNYSCPTTGSAAFITNTSFWLGSASNAPDLWIVDSDGILGNTSNDYDTDFGVRPVIVIEKSNL